MHCNVYGRVVVRNLLYCCGINPACTKNVSNALLQETETEVIVQSSLVPRPRSRTSPTVWSGNEAKHSHVSEECEFI